MTNHRGKFSGPRATDSSGGARVKLSEDEEDLAWSSIVTEWELAMHQSGIFYAPEWCVARYRERFNTQPPKRLKLPEHPLAIPTTTAAFRKCETLALSLTPEERLALAVSLLESPTNLHKFPTPTESHAKAFAYAIAAVQVLHAATDIPVWVPAYIEAMKAAERCMSGIEDGAPGARIAAVAWRSPLGNACSRSVRTSAPTSW